MFKGSLALNVACGKVISYSHPYLILNLDISKPFGEKSKEISQQNQIHKLVIIIIGLMEF